MNTRCLTRFGPRIHRAAGCRAFTLIEMATTAGLFTLVVIALIYTQIFALRQDQLTESKLGASDSSRRGFSQMGLDIRSAKIWTIGDGSDSAFAGIPNGTEQRGTAIQLSLTTDTNHYIRYFFNTNAGTLFRVHSGSRPTLVCKDLTNSMFFQAEDYHGDMQTDLSHKGVIHVMLEFAQYQYPQTKVGAGYLYDYYKMEFRYTPHVPDGP